MNGTLIFSKIVLLAFNILNPTSFSLVEVFPKFFFLYDVKLDHRIFFFFLSSYPRPLILRWCFNLGNQNSRTELGEY